MAARNSKPTDTTASTEQQPNPAVIRTQQYEAGTGWDVGQTAPSDAFRALDDNGTGAPVGPVVYEHPGGYARQIVAKGALVTDGVKRELDAAEQSDSNEG